MAQRYRSQWRPLMCRHLAYLGPPVTLASLVLEPANSLYRQSWAPTDMRGGGSVNADGFGLAWYPPPAPALDPASAPALHLDPASAPDLDPASAPHLDPAAGPHPGPASSTSADAAAPPPSLSSSGHAVAPVRYRRSVPIWADAGLPGLAGSVRSGAVLAAVRNGTVGMPLGESAVAPFQDGRWSFSHNGRITGWPGSVAKLAETLPVEDLLTLDAPMDSALLWALIRRRLDSTDPREAVASVVLEVASAAPGSRLNVLLTDGEQLIATTWTHSLWVRQTADSVTVSSEPWSDGADWSELPDQSLLTATKHSYAVTPLTQTPLMQSAPKHAPMEGR